MPQQRTYMVIDMKCFYASVECAERQLNPFETCLVVADETRGPNALCLAISPRMKALGIKNRCRLSDIPKNIKYIIAPPRMQLYIRFAREVLNATTRYTAGDWGDLCESDKELNEQALQRGGRILAAYPTSLGRMYIITDDTTAERLVTTVLFADEY